MESMKERDIYGQEVSIGVDDIVSISPCSTNGADAVVVSTEVRQVTTATYYLPGTAADFVGRLVAANRAGENASG